MRQVVLGLLSWKDLRQQKDGFTGWFWEKPGPKTLAKREKRQKGHLYIASERGSWNF